jgi:hypothetical protein
MKGSLTPRRKEDAKRISDSLKSVSLKSDSLARRLFFAPLRHGVKFFFS